MVCVEGAVIQHGRNCTPRCDDGFLPSLTNLYCNATLLEPTSFSCGSAQCLSESGQAKICDPAKSEINHISMALPSQSVSANLRLQFAKVWASPAATQVESPLPRHNHAWSWRRTSRMAQPAQPSARVMVLSCLVRFPYRHIV